jgi:D-glycero-D-manno-heptose 1,7-bisphosphate phosphatase
MLASNNLGRPAVFLDRDGVLTRVAIHHGLPIGPISLDEFVIVPGIGDQIKILRSAGFLIIVVTNQPAVGRGLLAPETMERMHALLRSAADFDALLVCPHVEEDNCTCRKPRPGMLLNAAEKLSVDLGRSFIIGDTVKDVKAGLAAGVVPILINAPYNHDVPVLHRVGSLAEAVELILATQVKDS